MRTWIFVWLCLLLGIRGVNAQQAPLYLSLQEALRLGLQKNPQIRAAYYQVKAAESAYRATKSQRLFTTKLNAGYQRFSSNLPDFSITVPTPVGPREQLIAPAFLNRYGAQLEAQQPLFTGGAIQSQIQAHHYQWQAVAYQLEATREELATTIQQAYWQLYTQKARMEVARFALQQMQAHLQQIKNHLSEGLVTTKEVLATETRLSEIRLQALQAQQDSLLAALYLKHLLLLPPEQPVQIVDTIVVSPVHLSIDSLVAFARNHRPELQQMHMQVQAEQAAIHWIKARQWPQIALKAQVDYARPNPYIFPPRDRFEATWRVQLVATLDIWNWGQTKAQINEATYRLRQMNTQLEALERKIHLEVHQAYLMLSQAYTAIEAAAQNVQFARENYRTTYARFQQGLALNTEVLDAEATLRRASYELVQAKAQYAQAQAYLQRAIGKLPNP